MSDLIESRLRHTASKGVSVWGDLMVEAAQEIEALRAAVAQPEQDLQLVANFLKEYGLEVLEVIAALKTQPEPEPVGWLYESRAGVRIFHPASDDKRFQADWEAAQQYPEAHKMTPLYSQSPQHLQSFAQDWDAPGMEAYDDPPLAQPEPTRSQQMRDAGYEYWNAVEGWVKIGGDQGLCFSFERKPKWFHRKMMQFCLGWEWKDTV